MTSRTLVTFILVAHAACATVTSVESQLPVTSEHAAERRTYSVATPAETSLVNTEIKPLVAAAMESKGYRAARTGESADVVVSYAAARRDVEARVHMTAKLVEGLGDDVLEHDFVETEIVIDASDRDGRPMWQSAVLTKVNPEKPNVKRLARAVDAALVDFPRAAR